MTPDLSFVYGVGGERIEGRMFLMGRRKTLKDKDQKACKDDLWRIFFFFHTAELCVLVFVKYR